MNSLALLSVAGPDRPGIIAAVSDALYQAGCSLEDSTMMHLSGHFAIFQMLRYPDDLGSVESSLDPAVRKYGLTLQLHPISNPQKPTSEAPNCEVEVHGVDHPGIIAAITGALEQIGFNVLSLDGHLSQEAGQEKRYRMRIRGYLPKDSEVASHALATIASKEGLAITVTPLPAPANPF